MRIITLAARLPSRLALPTQLLDFTDFGLAPRADPSLTGYLGVFFLGDKPSVCFYLSNGNNANSMVALNKGSPVFDPTKGTVGVRDPSTIPGSGDEAGKKWYIIGTDLNIAKTTRDAVQRKGSRRIFVWESTDLITWTNERLVTVENATAGMSFSAPQDYINRRPTSIIDLEFLPLGNNTYARFMKDESAKIVFTEISTSGLFETWVRLGGSSAVNARGVADKTHLLLDFYGGDGYRPYESTDMRGRRWTASDGSGWPKILRHGSVLPITGGEGGAG
ncbi:hypothetical protein EK21DRAFT_105223 [Setomelanomma holmii]|uniref:Arabinosidase n=1 Tax=Setomelanomma holmii TaxID=210430 RepID=A0A9P4GXZ4_9PLEO|nr:hypothetical protein EK21DRAFT_105223 [Setomelanomma holmii]